MNVVDSSGWLEYFANGSNAAKFAVPLKDAEALVVPVVIIYEVFKVVLRERGENDALQVVMAMQKGNVIDMKPQLAMSAAKLSLEFSLPMADSMILAAARAQGATLWTQDAHFKDIPGVKCLAK